MPLFSEHISNMYYGGSPLYTSSSYGYNSSVLPLGNSYSASYLNPGGNYSNHSSLGGYTRTPLTSRWISGVGRNYSPILGTISERSTASPARINSPRRIPITKRSYGSSGYIARPININTADIDVSKDKYRKKAETPVTSPPQRKESPRYEKEKTDSPFMPRVDGKTEKEKADSLFMPRVDGKPEKEKADSPFMPRVDGKPEKEKVDSPFMPRVDGKPETGIDSSPGVTRSTIKRGRTVVRLHTIRRKDRDSPRKPAQCTQNQDGTEKIEKIANKAPQDIQSGSQESSSWRERLSDDLVYKDKKAQKSLGTKLAEKFMVKNTDKEETPEKESIINILPDTESSKSLSVNPIPSTSKSPERRCSMEILVEQAKLLDSLIRNENLSTAPLDLSKVGVVEEPKNNVNSFGPIKRRKNSPLQTTKSDHSLHESLKSPHSQDIGKNIAKRRSLKKSSSGGSIRRLDSITELPKEPLNINLPAIDESKPENVVVKPKPKLKTRITGSVEVSPSKSPLKFRIDDVVVEEKPRVLKKEITFSSKVDETPTQVTTSLDKKVLSQHSHNEPQNNKRKVKKIQNELPSPEPEDGNFWNKIGKRETIYLMKRKQFLQEAKEKHKGPYFWLPEEPSLNEDELEEDKQAVKVESDFNISIPNDIKTENTANSEASVDSMVDSSSKNSVMREATPKYSENVDSSEKLEIKGLAQNVDILKNHDVAQSLQKEDIPKHKLLQGSTQQKEVDLNPQISYLPKNEDTLENIPIIKNKEIVQNQAVSNTKTNAPIPKKNYLEKIEINDESQGDIMKNKEVKQFSQKEVIAKFEQPILAPKIDDIWDTKELKKPSQKGNEAQSSQFCSAVETSMISDIVKFTEQPSNNIKLGQVSNENQNTLNKEDKSNEVKVMDMVSKADNPTAIHKKKDMQESEFNKQNVTEILEKVNVLRENIDVEAKKKIPEVKEGESKIKSKVAKIKSSKKKESSKKSASNKSSEKNHNADNLSQTSILHEEKAKSDPKASNIENQASPKQHVGTVHQEKSDLITMNETCHTQLDTDFVTLPVKTNIERSVEYQRESPENHSEEASKSNGKYPNDINTSDSNNIPEKQVDIVSENIPISESEVKSDYIVPEDQKKGINNDNECAIKNNKQEIKRTTVKDVVKLPEPPIQKKLVKQEAASRPLIATPRPLQKRAPQVIHSSESSDSSSEEESSDEEDDECDASEDSEEFFECEVNPDGRTSTGSNDSGFDSSAPTSPAGFSQIRKDCDVNCHRKCEKLTANLCGVNQRLLVEALATRTASKKGGDVPGTSSTNVPANNNSADIVEQELEQSTAYGIFRKTGRFTPPARSIPRFRKYTIEDFHFIKVLGKGSFGKVLLAELRDTEYYYAVKCLKKDVVLEDDDVECTLIERKVLALGTNHPYLCHLFSTFQTDSHLFFVMEYLNGGDLMFHIQQSGRFPEARARFYGAEIVSGLKFLHKRGIIYRDLKLDNILLDFDGHVRIADFGMCKLQIYLDKTADTFCGTPDYMAPEIIKGLKYNQTVDWWSFGVLLYEMLIGQSPFSGCDEDELFWSICNEMPSYPRFLSQEALTILTRLLDKDARTRLGGTECMHGDIREQAFFHAIHWDRLERRDLEAPFRPRVRHPLDTQYFDRAFTGERPRLTAVEPHVLRSMDQEPFRGFSYTNPNATDR